MPHDQEESNRHAHRSKSRRNACAYAADNLIVFCRGKGAYDCVALCRLLSTLLPCAVYRFALLIHVDVFRLPEMSSMTSQMALSRERSVALLLLGESRCALDDLQELPSLRSITEAIDERIEVATQHAYERQ